MPTRTLKTAYLLAFSSCFFDMQNNLLSMPMFYQIVGYFNLIFLYIENCSHEAINLSKFAAPEQSKLSNYSAVKVFAITTGKSAWSIASTQISTSLNCKLSMS